MSTASEIRARVKLRDQALGAQIRQDYNENHDPENGRFSSGAGGSGSGGGSNTLKVKLSPEREANVAHRVSDVGPGGKEANVQYGGGVAGIAELKAKGGEGVPKDMRQVLAHEARVLGIPKQMPGHVTVAGKDFEDMVKSGSYSTVTAHNPLAEEGTPPKTKAENGAAMREMLKDLKTQGASFTIVEGKYGNPETTAMIHHTASFGEKEVEALGKKYVQSSVMHAVNGEARMVFVNGTHAGEVHKSAGLTFDAESKNYYTKYHGVKFSYAFPTMP